MLIKRCSFFFTLLTLSILIQNLPLEAATNKTFLMPRPIQNNLALEYSGWHNQIKKTEICNKKSTFQVSTFYQKSTDKHKLGKYFGYHAKNEHKDRDYINVVNVDNFEEVGDNTWASYIVHDTRGTKEQNLAGKIKFHPEQEIYGVRFDYHVELNQILKGLSLEFALPITHIENNLNFSHQGKLTPITFTDSPAEGKTLSDYFKGKVFDLEINSDSLQQALTNAKIDGSQSRCGMADFAAKIGYKFINKKNWWVSMNGYVTMPSSNRPNGEFLFEPICGNGGHWTVGFGPDLEINLWKNKKYNLDFFSVLKVEYGINNTEKRTLGIKDDNGHSITFGQYYLVGQKGSQSLFPFANVSTVDLKVDPKWQFEGLFDLAFKINHLHFDLGYDIFAKESECISLKKSWKNDTYAIAQIDYATSSGDVTAFYFKRDPLTGNILTAPENIDSNILGQHFIQKSNLDINSAATPSYNNHKFYLTMGYMIDGKNPFLINLGGAYEFTAENTSISNYSVWINLSLNF